MGYIINLHVTEYCNYKCKFCYGKFQNNDLKLEDWKHIIDNILLNTSVKRFNIAGGEPLSYKYTQDIIDYISERNIETSIITNGHLLTKEFILANKDKVGMIGISVDSLQSETNKKIGRHSNQTVLDIQKLKSLCKFINDCGIELKINTVVTSVNYNEDINEELIKGLKVSRWKVLEMQLINGTNDLSKYLKPSNEEFEKFLDINKYENQVVERDEDFNNAYIIVSNQGKLVDNSRGSYEYLGSLLEEDFDKLFNKYKLNLSAYTKRYA